MPGKPIDIYNCTIELLQSSLLKIGHLITNANIVSSTGCSIPLRTFVWLSEMAIPSAGDSSSGVNHAAISKLEPPYSRPRSVLGSCSSSVVEGYPSKLGIR